MNHGTLWTRLRAVGWRGTPSSLTTFIHQSRSTRANQNQTQHSPRKVER